MGAQKRIESSHFITHWNRHTRGWIFGRFLITNPQRIFVALLANSFLIDEFVAFQSQHVFGAGQLKILAIGKNGLGLDAHIFGTVHLQASDFVELFVGADWSDFQRGPELSIGTQLVGLDGSAIVVDTRTATWTIIPGLERFSDFGIGNVQNALYVIRLIPFWGIC